MWINLPCTADEVGPLKWGLMWMFLGCGGCCWWCCEKLGGGEFIIRGGGSIWGRIGGERWAMWGGIRGWRGCWFSGRPCPWKGGGPLRREGWCCWDCICWWGWWERGIRDDGCKLQIDGEPERRKNQNNMSKEESDPVASSHTMTHVNSPSRPKQ